MKDVRAALATAEATSAAAAQPATTALIPKPRGTSGRGGFNLAKEMDVDKETYHLIQVSIVFYFPTGCSSHSLGQQGFVRSLVNMSGIDKSTSWKNLPGDEVHKIFTVVRRIPLSSQLRA